MSTLETNSIGKYNGNNVSFDDAVRLKNYTTTQRDALTSVAGDLIYNSSDSEVQVYDGSSWVSLGAITQGASISVDYLVVGSGGGACRNDTHEELVVVELVLLLTLIIMALKELVVDIQEQ